MAEPGDMIEIQRDKYCHWALYVGNGYIIHMTGDGVPAKGAICGICASTVSCVAVNAIVKKEKLKEVAVADKWSVHNRLDNECETKSPDVILKEAEQLVGKKIPYNLITNNCEHFVTNLRYGKPESRQVLKVVIDAAKGYYCSCCP